MSDLLQNRMSSSHTIRAHTQEVLDKVVTHNSKSDLPLKIYSGRQWVEEGARFIIFLLHFPAASQPDELYYNSKHTKSYDNCCCTVTKPKLAKGKLIKRYSVFCKFEYCDRKTVGDKERQIKKGCVFLSVNCTDIPKRKPIVQMKSSSVGRYMYVVFLPKFVS